MLDSIIKTVPVFPKVENNNYDLSFLFYRYNSLYISTFRMKPDKTKFASAMVMFNRIDIFDSEGNLENSIIEGEDFPEKTLDEYLKAKQENIDKINVKRYYQGSFVSDSYIYCLYYNQLQNEYSKNSIPVEVRIFNWSGEPLCKIKVPDYLQSFTIDEKNGLMYGIALFDEKILIYDIKSILNEI